MARKESVERAEAYAGGFATAKKNLVIQYEGRERSANGIFSLIKREMAAKGISDEDITDVDVYVKPQEQAIYYVVNKTIEGKLEF